MKKGDSVKVSKKQTQKTIDYLKKNNIKPLSEGQILSVSKIDGDTFYLIQFQYGTLSLPESAVEDPLDFDKLFKESNSDFGRVFNELFKGGKK